MKSTTIDRLVALQASRRALSKGAAGSRRAGARLGRRARRPRSGRRAPRTSLRAEILKIPGVGMGSPTDADWQKVGEMCLGGTKATVQEGEFAGRRAHLHGAQQPEPAQLPVPRLPEALGDLHRRHDQLDRPRPGRLQRPPAAVDRHRHRRLRRDRDGRALRGRRLRQGPRLGDARLGRRADRHGRLRQLPEGAGRHLGRQDLPHLDRRRLPHLQPTAPTSSPTRPSPRRGRPTATTANGACRPPGQQVQAATKFLKGKTDPTFGDAALRLPRPAQGLGRLRLLLPRGPRHRLRQAPGRPGLALRPRHHEAAGQQPRLRARHPGRARRHGHPAAPTRSTPTPAPPPSSSSSPAPARC